MEVYGDDYHVLPFHPGLGKMVNLNNLSWEMGENWHFQTVGSTENLTTKTTPLYTKWRQECLAQGDGILPKYGAIWFAYYPNIMIEVYPYTITVSTLHPLSPTKTMNVVEFFYHESVSEELIEAEKMAYMETALEDDEIAERMDAGRRALIHQSEKAILSEEEFLGPYHRSLEAGTSHFHEWYKKSMAPS
jgi:choline monooxygenase